MNDGFVALTASRLPSSENYRVLFFLSALSRAILHIKKGTDQAINVAITGQVRAILLRDSEEHSRTKLPIPSEMFRLHSQCKLFSVIAWKDGVEIRLKDANREGDPSHLFHSVIFARLVLCEHDSRRTSILVLERPSS